ncbi:MAG: V-type ATPase 116kDa subunit family protein [Eubacterium sp.]|nr:V-type ATPase 116kDa subunit family protein [Eubacterium sp.]
MIEKMKFLSITGPVDEIDRLAGQYLTRYEIHLENALSELKSNTLLRPFTDVNPYLPMIKDADALIDRLPEDLKKKKQSVSREEASTLIDSLRQPLTAAEAEKQDALTKRKKLQEVLDQIQPFRDLDLSFGALRNFRFIRYRFGRIPRNYYSNFETYIYENSDSIFYRCHADSSYVYGVYFSPAESRHKTDAVYASMHFERIYLPMDFEGKPEEEYENLRSQIAEIDRSIEEREEKLARNLADKAPLLIGARDTLKGMADSFDIRKLAACTKNPDNETFFILCGWMAEKDANALREELEADPVLTVMEEEDSDGNPETTPPTKLKNPKIFRPFELFVRMYGLPAYNEMDPTIYLAVTYSFIFGIMFGDAGQGLCLLIGGLLLYKFKKKPLMAIIGTCGIFSTIFGFIYNSFFGFEEFFPYEPLIRPKDDMVNLPVLGSINTVFVLAIAFGMFVILFNIVLAIINAVRQQDTVGTFFSQNAIAGLVFYGSITGLVFLIMTGHGGLKTLALILVVLAILGIVGIFLKELLANLVTKKKPAVEGGGMYFVQSFFETFETLLSFLSNTLSYVRIGAYAVSHVAMMQVVMMLAQGSGSSPNPVMLVFGNAFVMVMEGLMVGIQVLRLEYYEMFSRFYKGNGREFKPFKVAKES